MTAKMDSPYATEIQIPPDGLVGEEDASELRSNPVLLDRVWSLLSAVAERAQNSDTNLFRVPRSKDHACELLDACGEGTPRKGRVWVFDPIDGTKTYMSGEMYAVNVALLEDGKQVLSIVACPSLSPEATGPINDKSIDPSGRGTVFFAARGHGTYIRALHPTSDADAIPRKLNPHPQNPTQSDLRFVTCTTAKSSGSVPFHESVATSLGMSFPGCDLLPWVVRWASLAMGMANTTIWVYEAASRRGKIWDHAGAMLLFEEVGGKVTDVFGRDIDLGAGRLMEKNFGFVASLGPLHGAVLEATRKTMREFGKGDVLDG
ncbi:related to 3`(2`),5`-bisphosphate nucleotidase [Cephalotrichum gorgonifer]|uniref:Related to 3`(2`),5`-bisphosphate nucleotidase n=1 Tax=Cephalotrichum gorgonifer TaxID=2041049 RepID=A0AAE8N1F5_9PEZI|nr:related to 3`(2`),5`-bisphosphate nucleotidase [Cephalotrichum gorgonifer]